MIAAADNLRLQCGIFFWQSIPKTNREECGCFASNYSENRRCCEEECRKIASGPNFLTRDCTRYTEEKISM